MGRPAGGRTRAPRASHGLLAVAVALVLGLAGCTAAPPSGGTPSGSPDQSGQASPSQSLSPRGDPTVPASGALVGAWVRPTPYTQQGRIDAIGRFEKAIGRPLDIVHTYRKWTEDFFSPSDLEFISSGHLLQLSWAGDDTRKIASGAFDALIEARARAAKEMGKPFLMEWRWEMDRPNLQTLVWSPADYIRAWVHIHAIFDQVGVTNASWVWCPTVDGFANGKAPAYYPGDEWVDWVCVDAYPGKDLTPMSDLLAPFLTWAQSHDKPIIIGEYGVPRNVPSASRAAWLDAASATFQSHSQIKAVVYYDENPDGHQLPRSYVLEDDHQAIAAFARMAQSAYFNPDHRVSTG